MNAICVRTGHLHEEIAGCLAESEGFEIFRFVDQIDVSSLTDIKSVHLLNSTYLFQTPENDRNVTVVRHPDISHFLEQTNLPLGYFENYQEADSDAFFACSYLKTLNVNERHDAIVAIINGNELVAASMALSGKIFHEKEMLLATKAVECSLKADDYPYAYVSIGAMAGITTTHKALHGKYPNCIMTMVHYNQMGSNGRIMERWSLCHYGADLQNPPKDVGNFFETILGTTNYGGSFGQVLGVNGSCYRAGGTTKKYYCHTIHELSASLY